MYESSIYENTWHWKQSYQEEFLCFLVRKIVNVYTGDGFFIS